MANLPSGTVTFLFTDIEGSTKMAQQFPDRWESLRQRHHAILQAAMNAYNGFVFQIIGDAFCVAFNTAGDALRAALQSQNVLVAEKWGKAIIKVRMGIHTGKAELQNGNDYQGYLTLSRVQRVMSIAYGGQILISNASNELIHGELPEGVSLLDMKEHRLKGLLNPEHLWQVAAPNLPKDFPPLQSLNDIPNNLPIQLTSFIGREKEIAELKHELTQHHLVTLTGSGGTGKTRLSLQVAAEVLDAFPDGVWFLELAPVSDPALVPNTLANLLGLRESSETKQSIEELVAGYLHSRKALLVFDNCEHLIEACARFVDRLLHTCKDVRILATSREALGVSGELAWHVPSLSLPDLKNLPAIDQLPQYEAVRLFIDRATLVQPRFAVTKDNAPSIAQICFRLDGIPLAIELAAARSNVLTVEQIAKRLDDRFRLLTGGARTALPRQQTLRALIDWSYNLLSEEERLLFKRLAVFIGGWTLEAAEAVCGDEGLDRDLVLDLLGQLVKKSLVVMSEVNGESRYHGLETIRQYAREKLFETDEAAHIRDRHLEYFVQLADQGHIELEGPNDLEWIEKLETENDNLRAALSWSLESPEVDPHKALQLSGALQDFWDSRGYTSEGHQWLSAALKHAPAANTPQYCRALIGLGLMCIRLSRFQEACQYLEEALVLARQLNHTSSLLNSLLRSTYVLEDQEQVRQRAQEGLTLARSTRNPFYLAMFLTYWALSSDHAAETTRYIQEASAVAERLGNHRLKSFVGWTYGRIEMFCANYPSATAKAQEALRLSQLLKDKHVTAHCLLLLGRIAAGQTDHETAFHYEEDSLQIFRELSDRSCSMQAVFHLGWSDYLTGQIDRAAERFKECAAVFREIKEDDMTSLPLLALGRIAGQRGQIDQAHGYLREALELLKKSNWTYPLARCLEAVCALPALPPDRSARLLGKASAIREQEGFVIPISERPLVDPIVERLHTQLDQATFNAAQAAGAALTYQQVIDEALEALTQ